MAKNNKKSKKNKKQNKGFKVNIKKPKLNLKNIKLPRFKLDTEKIKVWFKDLGPNLKNSITQILTILKKELKHYMITPSSYLVMAVFLIIVEFFFFTSVLQSRQVDMRPLLDFYIPIAFILFIPAVTMSSIAQEKKEETLEFFATQPVTEIQILISKFISSLIFAAITTLLTVPAVVSVGLFGTVDWGQIAGQYLAILILAFSMTSIGTFTSSIVKSQFGALLLGVLFNIFAVIIGMEFITRTVPFNIGEIFSQISLFSHYQSLARGVIDFGDLIYLLAVAAVFLFASYPPLIKNKFGAGNKIYRRITILTIAAILVAGVAGFAGDYIPGRIDLTSTRKYTLSQTTKDILKDTEEKVKITVYVSSELPAQLQPYYRDIEDMLRNYQRFGDIKVEYKYPDKKQEIEQEAQEKGIQFQEFNLISAEELSFQKVYLGLVIEYKDQSEVISFVGDTSKLEYELSSRIYKMSTDEDRKNVNFVENSNQRTSYTEFKNYLEDEYNVDTFKMINDDFYNQNIDAENSATDDSSQNDSENENIENDVKDIPENTDVLVITGQTKDYPEKALENIKSFINSGGSLLVYLDPVTINQMSVTALENKNNLQDLLNDYGIEVNNDLVYDLQYNEVVTFGDQSGSAYMFEYPFWIIAQPNKESSITRGLDSVTLKWPSSIDVNEDNTNGADVEKIVTTSNFADTQEENFNVSPQQDFNQSEDELGKESLGVSFKQDMENDDSKRIVVVTDSEFLSDESVGAKPNNLNFGIQTVEWLAQSAKLSEIRAKQISVSPLIIESALIGNLLKYGNILGVTLIVATFGTIVTIVRKRKSKLKYK